MWHTGTSVEGAAQAALLFSTHERERDMTRNQVLSLLAVGTFSFGLVHAGNIEAGKAKAADLCADCHGDTGKGDADTPTIAGMATDKFTTAMQEYQASVRTKSRKMIKAANKVNADEIADLAAYYGSLK